MLIRILDLIFRRYRVTIDISIIICVSYFIAQIINVLIYKKLHELPSLNSLPSRSFLAVPQQSPSSVHQNATSILERNLMKAQREDLTPAPTSDNSGVSRFNPDRVMPCTIAANLVAIIAGSTPDSSYIIYRDARTQESEIYAPVDSFNQLPDGAVLLEVNPAEAKFRKDDHVELCGLGEFAQPVAPAAEQTPVSTNNGAPTDYKMGDGVKKVSENEFEIQQGEINSAMQNLNQIATDARIVPAFKDGKSEGFKMFSIRPGSVFQKLGLQNGDVVQKINGYEMNSPDKALEVYSKLRDAKTITIQLDRRGTGKTVTYRIR